MPKAVDGWKICSKCRERKAISEFARNRCNPDDLQYKCKACYKRYRQSNEGRAVHRAAGKRYAQSGKGKVAQQTADKHYQQTELGRATSQRYRQSPGGSATRRAAQQRYSQTEGGQQVARQATTDRRARKVGCVGSHTFKEFGELCERYDFRCLCCGEQFPLEELTEDHIIPIGPGVSDYIENIQPLCGSCNASKSRKTIDFRSKVVATYA